MTANSGKTVRRGPGRPFQKGVSGNPSGRPLRTAEEFGLIKACQEKAPEALVEIHRLMHEAEAEKVRLAAAAFIIERGYGKAIVRSEQPASFLEQETVEVLLAMRDEIKRRMAKELQAPGAVLELSPR